MVKGIGALSERLLSEGTSVRNGFDAYPEFTSANMPATQRSGANAQHVSAASGACALSRISPWQVSNAASWRKSANLATSR